MTEYVWNSSGLIIDFQENSWTIVYAAIIPEVSPRDMLSFYEFSGNQILIDNIFGFRNHLLMLCEDQIHLDAYEEWTHVTWSDLHNM